MFGELDVSLGERRHQQSACLAPDAEAVDASKKPKKGKGQMALYYSPATRHENAKHRVQHRGCVSWSPGLKEVRDREKTAAARKAAPAVKGGKGGRQGAPDNGQPHLQRDQHRDHSRDTGRYHNRGGGHQGDRPAGDH